MRHVGDFDRCPECGSSVAIGSLTLRYDYFQNFGEAHYEEVAGSAERVGGGKRVYCADCNAMFDGSVRQGGDDAETYA